MHINFICGGLPRLIVIFIFCSCFTIQADTQQISALLGNEPYSLSYAAGGYDPQGNFLGGTELMNLAALGGKLYAGVGYWMDRPELTPQHPDPVSGAQILVLDSKTAQWRQEYAFNQKGPAGALIRNRLSTMEVLRFHRFDAAGNAVGNLAEMLAVGLDGPSGTIYTQGRPGYWEDTRIPTPIPIRSLTVHYDPTDKTEKVYAAPGGDLGQLDRVIFSGAYDMSAPGRIRWNPTPEHIGGLVGRVMSMTECDGALFAAARPSIFRRDDADKSWHLIYTYPVTDAFDLSKYASGFRGLTCTNAPDGKKILLSAFEGRSGDILNIDPRTGAAVVELDTREFLGRQWGSPSTEDIIAGYNDIPVVKSAPSEVRLFGLLCYHRSADANELDAAWVLSRTAGNPPRYELHEVSPPPNWPYARSDSKLWSVRAIAVSPFPEDRGQVVYLGGYDGHFKPDHNTAWLYRGGVDTALASYAAR